MANTQHKCKVCLKRIVNHEKTLQCTSCINPSHIKCLANYNDQDIIYASLSSNHWTCPKCLSELFPYNSIEDTQTFIDSIINPNNNNIELDKLVNMVYDPFEDNDDDGDGDLEDIDPEKKILSEIRG
jgi:hypothetical protein